MENLEKRPGGLKTNEGQWRVLEESRVLEDGYQHSCGEDIMGVLVPLTVRDGIDPLSGRGKVLPCRVPFCPRCEKTPKSGVVTANGEKIITPRYF